jgi:site-specific DNA recombinase
MQMSLDFSTLTIGSIARKSTKDKEDQQVLSIASQHEANEQSVRRAGGRIAKRYTEEASAKAPGRRVFNELIADIQARKIDVIVCWRLNRLARNPIDGGRVQWLLQRGDLKAIITSEKVYLPSDNVIQMAVEFGMSTQYSIDLGKDVKRGMLQKVNAGWKPGIAPIGYLSDYGGVKGEKVIHREPERFPIIRRCWEYLLTGAYTVTEIHKLATEEWGLTIRRGRRAEPRPYGLSSMYAMFTEPFYYGEFEWNGQRWQGAHTPVITREEFDRAQDILGARGKPRRGRFEHPYPGLLRCGSCGASIVYECKRKVEKGSGILRTYCYFHCSKRKKGVRCEDTTRLRPDELQAQIDAVIASVRLPRAFVEWALRELQLSQEDRAALREQELKLLQDAVGTVERKIDALLELRLSSPTVLPDVIFQTKLQALEQEKRRAEAKMNDHGAAVRTWRDALIEALLALERIRDHFAWADAKERVGMLTAIGSRLELANGQLHFVLAEPFRSLIAGREYAEKALLRLGTGEIGFHELKEPALSHAVSVWSRLLEQVRKVMVPEGAHRTCQV